LAAKAALVLDETPLARCLEHYRRIIAVAVKVLFYGVASLLLLSVERVLEALPKVHSFDAAFRYAFEHATRYRALSWALGISIVFALYFAFFEINERMGEGELWRLFFESPKTATNSRRPSTFIRVNGGAEAIAPDAADDERAHLFGRSVTKNKDLGWQPRSPRAHLHCT
jgi:hypothetical protein